MPEGDRYRPGLFSECVFRQSSTLPVEGVGALSREFHRDMVELNPAPCDSLVEHHRRLHRLMEEARARLRDVHSRAELLGLALHPGKVDPVADPEVDVGDYAARHVFPDPRYRRLLRRYRALGETQLRGFLSMGSTISYQAEFSCPRERVEELFEIGRGLVPAMVALAANSPASHLPGMPLAGRIGFYRRTFCRGTQPAGIPLEIPRSFEAYVAGLRAELPAWKGAGVHQLLSLDYRWVRLNVPTSLILEPREIDSQPTLLENVALQAVQFGLTEASAEHPMLALLRSAEPRDLERSLGSAAAHGLRGHFHCPEGSRCFADFWEALLPVAQEALRLRGLGEERLVAPLFRRVEARQTPAEVFLELRKRRGTSAALREYVDRLRADEPLI